MNIKKIRHLVLLSGIMLFWNLNMDAQDPGTVTIDSEKTVDAEQNDQWKSGDNPYPARPRDMWELGVNIGHPMISGDVEPLIPSGFGAGLHLRKSLNYFFSLKLTGNYFSTKGLDARPQSLSSLVNEKTFTQNNLKGRFGEQTAIHRNYKTTIWTGGLEGVVNIGNLLFHQPNPKWNMNISAGIGFQIPKTRVNLFDGNNNYNWASVTQGLDLGSKSDRKTARKRLKDMLDNSWETKGGVDKNIRALGDDKSLYPTFTGSLGVVRKINDRINLGLQHQVVFADNDLLDGFEYRSASDMSNSNDVLHYTSLSLNFNLGKKSKRTEPLYWNNPMAPVLSDVAEVKSRPVVNLSESEVEDLLEMLERDAERPEPLQLEDVAQYMQDQGYLTEDEINEIINNKISNLRMDWWLPMIHFDLDKYYVRPEFYGHLKHVATVLKNHPNEKMVVRGFADNRGAEDYNEVLSYNRAKAVIDYLVEEYDIPRERMILQYKGEDEELVPGLPDNHTLDQREERQQFLNRRVEFYIARPGDESMDRPDGPEAGEGTPGSSRPGTKYSGNKNSGY